MTRVLIVGAGRAAATNLVRSLRASSLDLFLAGCHSDRFALKSSACDVGYLLRQEQEPIEALNEIIAAESIDLVIPTSDGDVYELSRTRHHLKARVVLPDPAVVDLCQDKYLLAKYLHVHGVPVPLYARAH